MVYHKNNKLGALKLLVYSMGVVLMLGIMALVYIIYKQNWTVLKGVSNAVLVTEDECQNLSAKMIVDSEIQNITGIDNKMILVTMPRGNMQKIIVFDYCKNKILNDLYIEIKTPSTLLEEEIIEKNNDE